MVASLNPLLDHEEAFAAEHAALPVRLHLVFGRAPDPTEDPSVVGKPGAVVGVWCGDPVRGRKSGPVVGGQLTDAPEQRSEGERRDEPELENSADDEAEGEGRRVTQGGHRYRRQDERNARSSPSAVVAAGEPDSEDDAGGKETELGEEKPAYQCAGEDEEDSWRPTQSRASSETSE